ncbi:hypothetical protein K474DRAFT_1662575 [Panus rudis PR-1116 ss-1]|nr:hypothetical protein K474DRAFT_1662575 [Panus rudis PR-1116 ss-1]
MAHRRTASNRLNAPSIDVSDEMDTQTHDTTNMVPSFSTPDISLSLYDMSLAQSSSLPSLSSVMSDMTSSTSYPSSSSSSHTSTSFSSIRSLVSLSSFESAPQQYASEKSQKLVWQSSAFGDRLPFAHLTNRRTSIGANILKKTRLRDAVDIVQPWLPRSYWDRFVAIIFLLYLSVFLRAMAGIGGNAHIHHPVCDLDTAAAEHTSPTNVSGTVYANTPPAAIGWNSSASPVGVFDNGHVSHEGESSGDHSHLVPAFNAHTVP